VDKKIYTVNSRVREQENRITINNNNNTWLQYDLELAHHCIVSKTIIVQCPRHICACTISCVVTFDYYNDYLVLKHAGVICREENRTRTCTLAGTWAAMVACTMDTRHPRAYRRHPCPCRRRTRKFTAKSRSQP